MSRSYAQGRRYAEGTKVPVSKSKREVEGFLQDLGAEKLISGWDSTKGVDVIQALVSGRMLRFEVWEDDDPKETRRRWRVLVLVVKAKVEAIRSGDSDVESEFLANLVLPDGTTVGGWVRPQLAGAYERGEMPRALLPGETDPGDAS